MKSTLLRHFPKTISILSLLGTTTLYASGFQLWEQDGASIGLYHAGYAAWANDASTAFYNPAGMTRIQNQQLVFAGIGVMTDFKFVGNVTVSTIDAGNTLLPVTAQGGNFSFIPALHYVTPLSDKTSFGFSIDVPFGLKTNYGTSTDLKYVATLTSANVIDISPSFAFQATDKASFGIGLDIQRMYGEFDQIGTFGGMFNTPSTNKVDDTGYGMHAGVLYQFTPNSRVGLSYHSQVVHHLTGSSKFVGPLADLFNNGSLISNHASVNITLPPYTALSFYHLVQPKVAMMGSIIYTQWSTFKYLILNNFAGLAAPGPEPSTTIQVVVPEHYRNSWNFTLGTEFYATDQITLRGGIGYDQTPVENAYRNVNLPDNDRYVIAFGGHYQASKAIGIDLGWTHFFIRKAHLNPPMLALGAQEVTTNGSVTGGADVFGAQITWNI